MYKQKGSKRASKDVCEQYFDIYNVNCVFYILYNNTNIYLIYVAINKGSRFRYPS